MAIMLGDMTAEQVLTFILDNECYNPGDPAGDYDWNDSDTWTTRKYYIEGHCTNYTITATKTATGYQVLRIESD
jgi:hypothetical protein